MDGKIGKIEKVKHKSFTVANVARSGDTWLTDMGPEGPLSKRFSSSNSLDAQLAAPDVIDNWDMVFVMVGFANISSCNV